MKADPTQANLSRATGILIPTGIGLDVIKMIAARVAGGMTLPRFVAYPDPGVLHDLEIPCATDGKLLWSTAV